MKVLGISCFYHDSAVTLLEDGRIVAAAQEERFSRVKHDARFPKNALDYCISEGGPLSDVDAVVYYEDPGLKTDRLFETFLHVAPNGYRGFRRGFGRWVGERAHQNEVILRELKEHAGDVDWKDRLFVTEHHLSHAASAFYPSPFDEAAVLTMDGVGEWATTTIGFGRGNQLDLLKEIRFPHSIGLLYSAFTYYTGFKVNSGEYKLMGLAPYGEPRFAQQILDSLVDIKEDGSYRINLDYFGHHTTGTTLSPRFEQLFGRAARRPEESLDSFHMDIAASIQAVTEQVVLRLGDAAVRETGCADLCLAGGVALNCVANGKLLQSKEVRRLWCQPAAGDAGGSLGAALIGYYNLSNAQRNAVGNGDQMRGSYLGPQYADGEIQRQLQDAGAKFSMLEEEELMDVVAQAIADGNAVGWMQGRAEFGPRALGNRSILADPRGAETQRTLNLKIKFRESFRPFAPAVLRENVSEWFDLQGDSPYMLLVAPVSESKRLTCDPSQDGGSDFSKLNTKRSVIPAVTHVDYSARVQTVSADTNPMFHKLIRRFNEITKCPILVNTSFNVRSEPIVNSPDDAFRCFMGTDLDVLVVGHAVLWKHEQDPSLKLDYRDRFDPD